MLIGFDFEYYTRDKSGNSVTRSENYLTGERVVVVKESERRRSGEFCFEERKKNQVEAKSN